MRAVLVEPPHPGAHVGERPRPSRARGEVRVAVREVGVCGTDRDIVAGKYGAAPTGSPDLVIGHENLGQVVESEGGPGIPAIGDWVVASVRRGCGRCRCCAADRSDLCESGGFRERGINGLDGYAAEEYVERPEFLHRVPPELSGIAVLLEPTTVGEKAIRVADEIARSRLPRGVDAAPRSALVAGSGAVGMLAAAALANRGAAITVVDRHPGATPAADTLRTIGVAHTTLAELDGADTPREFDLIVEATGAIDLPLTLAERLAPNGTLVLTGIPPADGPELPAALGTWDRSLVLGNRAVVGSVNAAARDFDTGLRDLASIERRWPGWLGRLITARRPWSEAPTILAGRATGEIKTVLRVAP